MASHSQVIATIGLLAAMCCSQAHADAPNDRDIPANDIVHHGIGQIVPSCATCHGAQGQGDARGGFPRLAGQRAAYLASQLDAFADGSRVNGVMAVVARALSEPERQQLAAYFANLPVPHTTAMTRDGHTTQAQVRGAQLAHDGDAQAHLPACTQCHGRNGVGIGGSFPSLAGQPANYLSSQLRAWKHGTRAPGPLSLMSTIASRLSDDDISAVSLYFSTLAPDATQDQP